MPRLQAARCRRGSNGLRRDPGCTAEAGGRRGARRPASDRGSGAQAGGRRMTASDAALLQLVRDSRQHIETVGADTESWLDLLDQQRHGLLRLVEAALE